MQVVGIRDERTSKYAPKLVSRTYPNAEPTRSTVFDRWHARENDEPDSRKLASQAALTSGGGGRSKLARHVRQGAIPQTRIRQS